MDNITMLCMFGLFMMFILLVLPRLMNMGQSQYGTDPRNDDDYRGGERPQYDDPDVEGRGSFGRPRNPSGGGMNFPWVGNRRNEGSRSSASRPSVDNRNVRGRGSFGRDKD